MASKFFHVLAVTFWVLAGLVWAVLGLISPGGVDRMGQPMDPGLYYQVGAFFYWLLGTAFLIPVGLLAGIGFIFSGISGKLSRNKK
jgi:hypothetical protein